MKLHLTGQAYDDLFSIWAHIARDSLSNADICVDRIMQQTAALTDFPKMGPARPAIGSDSRILIVERWLVIYRILPKEIRVARIVDASRDLRNLDIPLE